MTKNIKDLNKEQIKNLLVEKTNYLSKFLDLDLKFEIIS
jgi:hypothetical protein